MEQLSSRRRETMTIDPTTTALPFPTPVPAAAPNVHRYTILITDDDPNSREILAGLLEDRGFITLQAGSGEEAIDIVRVEMIHLIFTDMHMPRMTGLEALQQVRLINELLPAILMTADVTRELMRQALQAQVYSVIPKPVNKNLVLSTMLKALQRMYGTPPGPMPSDEPKPT
jgi:two-component system, response regulator PdtaR